MADIAQFTAAQAAFVLREPIRAVKKAFDLGPVRPILQLRSGASVRVIDWADLFYLFAARTLREHLTPGAREEFYKAVRHTRPEHGDEVRFGRFRVSVADLVDEVNRRTAELTELQSKVTFADDGKPAVGSRGVKVHRIASLLKGGLSVNAVLEEYPFLSTAAVETARAYAQAWPGRGRPYPRTTANRVMRGTPADEVPKDGDGGH
jgi:hypothetical protein